jgi:hypothetical protein
VCNKVHKCKTEWQTKNWSKRAVTNEAKSIRIILTNVDNRRTMPRLQINTYLLPKWAYDTKQHWQKQTIKCDHQNWYDYDITHMCNTQYEKKRMIRLIISFDTICIHKDHNEANTVRKSNKITCNKPFRINSDRNMLRIWLNSQQIMIIWTKRTYWCCFLGQHRGHRHWWYVGGVWTVASKSITMLASFSFLLSSCQGLLIWKLL